MSGSGGGGGGGGSSDWDLSCETLVIETQLSSPDAAVIASIQVNDVLPVETRKMNGTTAVAVVHQGQVAGGLATPELLRLRECLKAGTQYNAKVLSKSNGQVRVVVRPVQL
ncbi:hypothetical protein SAMN05518845_11689 [Variovorax sp. YR750]|uniref:hypothetical protein n=1 Tax=Variovorax sp. YR750 TaxID=1884384 RepID=UPI0008D6EFE0|nr:hypothetical protein [Variovorax sp. YR750]SEM10470.1 hypothetical protein SAMN05518845_11689 [Variovorax sp. YR750]